MANNFTSPRVLVGGLAAVVAIMVLFWFLWPEASSPTPQQASGIEDTSVSNQANRAAPQNQNKRALADQPDRIRDLEPAQPVELVAKVPEPATEAVATALRVQVQLRGDENFIASQPWSYSLYRLVGEGFEAVGKVEGKGENEALLAVEAGHTYSLLLMMEDAQAFATDALLVEAEEGQQVPVTLEGIQPAKITVSLTTRGGLPIYQAKVMLQPSQDSADYVRNFLHTQFMGRAKRGVPNLPNHPMDEILRQETDSDGSATLHPVLPQASYALIVGHEIYADVVREIPPLEAGQVYHLDVTMSNGAFVYGTVVDEEGQPANRANVGAFRGKAYSAPSVWSWVQVATQQTGPDGAFRIGPLRSGRKQVSVELLSREVPVRFGLEFNLEEGEEKNLGVVAVPPHSLTIKLNRGELTGVPLRFLLRPKPDQTGQEGVVNADVGLINGEVPAGENEVTIFGLYRGHIDVSFSADGWGVVGDVRSYVIEAPHHSLELDLAGTPEPKQTRITLRPSRSPNLNRPPRPSYLFLIDHGGVVGVGPGHFPVSHIPASISHAPKFREKKYNLSMRVIGPEYTVVASDGYHYGIGKAVLDQAFTFPQLTQPCVSLRVHVTENSGDNLEGAKVAWFWNREHADATKTSGVVKPIVVETSDAAGAVAMGGLTKLDRNVLMVSKSGYQTEVFEFTDIKKDGVLEVILQKN